MQTKNILLFNPVGKNAKVSVFFQGGTFWLTQKAMAELFGVNVPAVSKHLKNIFETGELEMASTVSILETVQKEGKREVTRSMEFYRLEAILNRIVSAYLDLAENNAQRGIAFNMQQWVKFIDGFLELSNYPILKDKGKVSMLEAKLKAEQEYDKFRVIQDKNYESDFDKEIKKLS